MIQITGKAKIAAVLGWPVAHSKSPLLHNFWLQRYQVDGVYVPLAVRPDNFPTVIKGMVAAGFKGCNVTIPHKEAAYACCDFMDESALRTGSVNTLVFKDDGKVFGTSTDGAGFIASLKEKGVVLNHTSVLILGAGGAARSVSFALMKEQAQITVANRTRERAEQIISSLGTGRVVDWDEWPGLLGDYGLLVNTTPLGMEGMKGTGSCVFDLSRASADLIVTDIVYVPRITPLLKAAREKGLKTVEGLGMLLHQARFGFKAWYGIDPEVDEEVIEFMVGNLIEHKDP